MCYPSWSILAAFFSSFHDVPDVPRPINRPENLCSQLYTLCTPSLTSTLSYHVCVLGVSALMSGHLSLLCHPSRTLLEWLPCWVPLFASDGICDCPQHLAMTPLVPFPQSPQQQQQKLEMCSRDLLPMHREHPLEKVG